MKKKILFFSMAGFLGGPYGQEMAAAKLEEPAYKVLYESGFYGEAIDYLEAKVRQTGDPEWREVHAYLAFCYILTGQSEKASTVFHSILDRDSAYALDSLQISPKIYEVFARTREARLQVRAWTPPPLTPAPAPMPEAAPASLFRPWYRIPSYLSPGGAGQFYNQQRKKGMALAAAQALFLGVSIVSYQQRRSYEDPDFGWYAGNHNENIRYGNRYRIAFSLFSAAYLFGIADAFWAGRTGL